jgi:hypothetical protein
VAPRLDQRTSIRTILLIVTLVTLPCYCIGLVIIQKVQGQLKNGTLTPTSAYSLTLTVKPLVSSTPSLTSTITPTPTTSGTPTITRTPTTTRTRFLTPTRTSTRTPTDTLIPTDTHLRPNLD